MNIFAGIGKFLGGRIDHVPDAGLQDCIDTFNAKGGVQITASDWREFESVQTAFYTHQLLKQVVPHNAPAAVGLGVGVVESQILQGEQTESTQEPNSILASSPGE